MIDFDWMVSSNKRHGVLWEDGPKTKVDYEKVTVFKSGIPVCLEIDMEAFMAKVRLMRPKRIIHSGPATIVFWEDGTKTVVKLSEKDTYDEYDAFTAAFAIKIFGSNSAVKKLIKNITENRNEK